MSRDEQNTVVLASGNAGKLRELAGILEPLGVNLVSQAQFSVPEVEETGLCPPESPGRGRWQRVSGYRR